MKKARLLLSILFLSFAASACAGSPLAPTDCDDLPDAPECSEGGIPDPNN